MNVNVVFDDSPTANATSLFTTTIDNGGPLSVFRQGSVDAVLSGIHNPSGPYDAAIHIGMSYLTNELWFDPDPANASSVPNDRTDAESVFTHEFGHIFAFNGDRDSLTGALLSNYESTFDALTGFFNNDLYFIGSDAENLYGGPVPLTIGNIYHVGNPPGYPGADMEVYPGDLMNGNIFYRGTKYSISDLDIAIAADLGLVVAAPEPNALVILCAYLTVTWCGARWVKVSA